LRKAISR